MSALRRPQGGIAILGALLLAIMVVASPARATVSCTFQGGVLSVIAPDAGDTVVIAQDMNGIILVNGQICSFTPVPVILNTSTVNITGGAGSQEVTIQLFDTSFGQALWSTINWNINLGTDTDTLVVDGSGDGPIRVTLGSSGVDLSSDGNLDVVPIGVEDFAVLGSPFEDLITGAGSSATGGPLAQHLGVSGGFGNDTIAGGVGDDILDAGTDIDVLDHSASGSPVAVNLSASVSSGVGLDVVLGFEIVSGSAFGDFLSGDIVPNRLLGGDGPDVLSGEGGDDFLNGGRGKDTADGGPNIDTCVRGGDTFVSCEVFVGGGPKAT